MRGNPPPTPALPSPARSIPAYAGEPSVAGSARPVFAVYPRVCGGTLDAPKGFAAAGGLSPRMRGNHSVVVQRRRYGGSIPAYAGEPCAGGAIAPTAGVYPRVCGGTGDLVGKNTTQVGLSPRMRGNRKITPEVPISTGSIPAYAGEPTWSTTAYCMPAVYPRVCGGTNAGDIDSYRVWGLSPRMRGNRCRRRQSPPRQGSIPAYAGEPQQ